MEAKISVIIPVYKVEQYLNRCILSVVNQTYANLEIILVDDGSPDNCGKMCDEWALKDSRIKVIHKSNGGLSDARNSGLDIATGDYIGFVDSDDSIEPDMFELLALNMKKYDADVSCCRYAKVWEDGRREAIGEDHDVRILEGLDGLKEYLYGETLDPFVWNKLYQAYYMRNSLDRAYSIRFIKGIVGEDNPFNVEIMKLKPKVVLAGEAKYNYLQAREGAITNARVSQKKIDSVFWWDLIRKECHERYPELEKYALRRQILFYVGLYNGIMNDSAYKSEADEVLQFVKEHKKEVLQSDICDKSTKVAVWILANMTPIYGLCMRTYKQLFRR